MYTKFDCSKHPNCRDISCLISRPSPHKLCWISRRSNSDYLTALFYTDCLFKPRAAKMLFYGCTCQTTKSFLSCPDYPRCNFNYERVYSSKFGKHFLHHYIPHKPVFVRPCIFHPQVSSLAYVSALKA